MHNNCALEDHISETATDLSKTLQSLTTSRGLSLGALSHMPARTHLLPLFAHYEDFPEIGVPTGEG